LERTLTLPLTEALQELIALGVQGEALVAAIRRLEAVTYSQRIETLEEAVRVAGEREDAALAARNAAKARDRERKRGKSAVSAEFHGNPGKSEEFHEPSAETPSPEEKGPTPQKTHTPTLPKDTPLKGCIQKVSRLAKPNGFSRFWEAYPNKVGKRAAEAAYDRALKRISGPDPPGSILAGLDRANSSRKWREEPEFIPHPTTWLNQDRWDDQPTEPQQPRQAHERPHTDQRQAARSEALRSHHAGAMAALNRRIGPVG
jgi:hypothetical protein